jgi:hypothetical protein
MKFATTASAQDPGITPEVCKSQLGERTFNLLRQAMLQQQETFIEQLWDLHRLTRAQHRKVVLLPAEEEASAPEQSVAKDVFSRSMQEQVRNDTMNAIWHLPVVPASLRRNYVATSAQKDMCVQDPVPCAADRMRTIPGVTKASDLQQLPDPKVVPPCEQHAASAPVGPLFPSSLKGKFASQFPQLQDRTPAGFRFQEQVPTNVCSWGAAIPKASDSAFSTTALAMHGQPPVCPHVNAQYIAGESPRCFGVHKLAWCCEMCLFLLHSFIPLNAVRSHSCNGECVYAAALQPQPGLAFAPMQMPSGRLEAEADGSAADPEPKDKAVAPAQPSQVDVSSLLGMMAPGLQSVPDLHSQWFQSNSSRLNSISPSVPLSAQAVCPGVLSVHKMMDVPVPDIPVRISCCPSALNYYCLLLFVHFAVISITE